ncbi:MAG: TetR family transcriptional regulator [Proteobacteria bacterium]|nr:TetR family transcriptional regulator [Pseudomonadota bacterium]
MADAAKQFTQQAGRAVAVRRRDAHGTKSKLLQAALRAFTTQGYEASSTRNIETTAGVKRGLISYHFGTKQALWEAVADHIMQVAERELSAAVRGAADADTDARARLRHFVKAYVFFCARHPELHRLMIQEGNTHDWRLDWLLERSVRGWYVEVCRLFDEALLLGVAPAMNAHHFYYILTGAATLMFANAAEAQALGQQNPLDARSVAEHADALANLFLSGESQ